MSHTSKEAYDKGFLNNVDLNRRISELVGQRNRLRTKIEEGYRRDNLPYDIGTIDWHEAELDIGLNSGDMTGE